jgi:hypothetical protein
VDIGISFPDFGSLFISTGPPAPLLTLNLPGREPWRKWMYKKLTVMAVVICLTLFMGLAGCAKKQVRHLASDVCLVTPEQTTREQVLSYLGPPDEQYEMAEGGETWIYYDVKKSTLAETPYIGDSIGDKKYDMVKVTFSGDIVKTCIYRSLTEEEFQQGGSSK